MAFSHPSMKVFLLFNLLFVSKLMPISSCDKVPVGLYYESLCPYSASFVVDSLSKIFIDGLISVVDLKLVPWGNAKIYGTHTFKCQVVHIVVLNSVLYRLGRYVLVVSIFCVYDFWCKLCCV